MVLIPARCLYCQSDHVTKRGKTTAGKQRYRCHNPDCTHQSFLLDPAYVHTITKQEQTIEDVDLVVLAYGGQAADTRSQAVRERVGEVYVIGDALAPRRLMDAILDGARLGRRL